VKRFEDFRLADIVSTDENIGIKYEKADIVEDTLLLLRYNCPDPSCDVACLGWPDLHRHVRSVHQKKMCDLCTRNKKVFTHEHELFTDKELERHMKKGDDNPGAIDQSGFRGHPLCGFCGERFYGDDELYVHCRSKHERCFICDRRSGTQPQYYVNYDSLELHFRKDHFLCPERGCLEKKFIVFESEIDMKHHQLEEHSNTLSKDARRDARVVDISSFDYRAPYVQERRGGGSQREGRGRGRGRDPNTDPIPAPSAQPLRRDEQAFQRQMAIQSAQSVSMRTFGGQLTSTPAPAARGPPGTRDPPSMTIPRPSSHADNVASQLSRMELQDSDGADVLPQEQARRLRHSSVIERAIALLQNDQIKLAQFRNAISSFRTNAISARALIDTFFALFSDTSSNALGSLVRDVADLYEDKAKAESLRTAWNDWRAINEDYPSLPGPSGLNGRSLPLGWAQITTSNPSSTATTAPKSTSRVLKLKSSTAQSSRSSASRNASWGSASASSANGFPGLPNPTVSAGASSIRPIAGIVRFAPPTPRPASRDPARVLGASGGSEAFPALPPAAKPTSTIFGYGTGAVRRDIGGGSNSSGFAWGASPAGSGTQSEARSESEGVGVGGAAGGGKKKGNKGKKEVLVKWG
jgi:E3 ubiquitin-protein ligase ZNF598